MNHPILHRAHLVLGHLFRHFEDVAVNFADCGGKGTERRLHAGREAHVLQTFDRLLARKIIVGAVGKGQCHHRQAGNRHRTDLRHAGSAGHADFNRQRDRPFYLFWCLAAKLRDDLHLHILHIGKCLNRQVTRRAQAKESQGNHGQQHKQALGHAKVDQSLKHRAQVNPE